MADIEQDTLDRLWRETKSSSWESLRRALDGIFAENVIDSTAYNRMLWAINKIETLGVDFPLTESELGIRLNHWM